MITLITGGQASGKSLKALELAMNNDPTRVFIATAQAFDDEMNLKIQKHIEERKNNFITIEQSIDILGAFENALQYSPSVILLDCLTMWVSNMMIADKGNDIYNSLDLLIDFLEKINGQSCVKHIIFVTNEVGLGIIPQNEMARKYIVLLGRTNKRIAAICDELILTVCGIAKKIKG